MSTAHGLDFMEKEKRELQMELNIELQLASLDKAEKKTAE